MVFERKVLRKIFDPTNENGIWRIKTNQELYKLIKHKNIINFHTIITPTKCTLLLLKAPDITICTSCATKSTDCNIWCF
jgi:hypothetical protein